ncbi:hypothetical protein PFDSM3638_04180 [Pyrococcus furiosus DSM 3638]|uniref:Uncharacterized protein n=3 Tax=Pyrococcus furiosus TaxID=2261 RepID=A0A5C0XP91_PYRFU|nr:hypothetical protein PF0841 [Pyrococcus furiosus DSM 3638]AFN03629.1 hypothetical protein PFC_03390 [Pyrococcus furiosus COM1]QEK78511.1 hypothetical protein PFDSM3638_04180 [Pyrococcus furiosus DSM 3638]
MSKDLGVATYRGYAIVGINGVFYEGEEFVELRNPLLALNVNTPEELKLAERIARLVDGRRKLSSEFNPKINAIVL